MLEMRKLYYPDTVQRYEKFLVDALTESCEDDCTKLRRCNLDTDSTIEYYNMLKNMVHTLAQTVLDNWEIIEK